jgi:hypothetical protein
MITSGEVERTKEEAVVAYLKVLPGMAEDHGKPQ